MFSGFADGSRGGGQPLVNGNRAQANNYRLDGVDANESQENGTAHCGKAKEIAVSPNVDAIQEFKLITTNPPAEYGNAMGAIVNTSLKSGTNEYHGDVFEFLRNDMFDSNTWFGNATKQPRPHLSQNIFGGTFGGPIRRNRLFFFTDYQGWRRGKGTTASVRTLIPAAWRTGDLSSLLPRQLYNPFAQDPDVVVRADGAASPTGAPREVHGAGTAARGATQFSQYAQFVLAAFVDGEVGLLWAPNGRLRRALKMRIVGERIVEIEMVAEPARLRELDLAVVNE